MTAGVIAASYVATTTFDAYVRSQPWWPNRLGWWRLIDPGTAGTPDYGGLFPAGPPPSNGQLTRAGSVLPTASQPSLIPSGEGASYKFNPGGTNNSQTWSVTHSAWMDKALMSYFCLIRPDALSVVGVPACVDNVGNNGELAWRLSVDTAGVVSVIGRDPVTPATIWSATGPAGSITVGVTKSIGFTHTGSAIRLYVNGVVVGTGTGTLATNKTGAYRIGALGNSNGINGRMQEHLWINQVISDADMLALHQATGL